MCGIIGYIGEENSLEKLVTGLRALEYRGYDSAGVAFFDTEMKIRVVKAAGRLSKMEKKLSDASASFCGIGHTRWATHGAPTDENSHPHGTEALQIVHNGIIENHSEIKKELLSKGYTFLSDTDTEVAAKLISHYYVTEGCSERAAIEKATAKMTGSWALGILFADRPNEIWAARQGSPLIVGVGIGHYIASDITAILPYTRKYYQLDDGEIALVKKDSAEIFLDGKRIKKELLSADWDISAAEKGGYPHFMLKEINEEAEVILRTLHPRIKDGLPDFSYDSLDVNLLKDVSQIHIVACGTAMHAGLIGQTLFSRLAAIPSRVEIASEFRYNDPIIARGELVIIISQSGETADSLAALRLAKKKGASVLAIVNVIGSSIAREADFVLYTMAGPEIAVASTKAYSVQTALLSLIAIEAGLLRGKLTEDKARNLVFTLSERAPETVSQVIARGSELEAIANRIASSEDLFFIGRGIGYHLAMEGSLKLKEISYIHSEAYGAGELKHGTISLITDGVPVIALCTEPALYEKTFSNILEAKARGALSIVISAGGIEGQKNAADCSFILPEILPEFSFLPAVTALQLIAYYTAKARNCDIDKPRNLAKSVTVE